MSHLHEDPCGSMDMIKTYEIVLVCSDAMARGMDISDVHTVINYDAPVYIKTYRRAHSYLVITESLSRVCCLVIVCLLSTCMIQRLCDTRTILVQYSSTGTFIVWVGLPALAVQAQQSLYYSAKRSTTSSRLWKKRTDQLGV